MMMGDIGHRTLLQFRPSSCVFFASFGVKKAANQLRDSAPLHVLAKSAAMATNPAAQVSVLSNRNPTPSRTACLIELDHRDDN